MENTASVENELAKPQSSQHRSELLGTPTMKDHDKESTPEPSLDCFPQMCLDTASSHEKSAWEMKTKPPGYPWDCWLVFWDKEMENQFWESRTDRLVKLESYCFGWVAIEALIVWFQLTFSGMMFDPMLHVLDFCSVCLCVWAALQAHHQARWYVAHRPLVVGTLRTALYFALVWNMTKQPAPATASTNLFSQLHQAKATIPGMVSGWIFLQVQFREQVLISGVCLIFTTILGCPGFCTSDPAEDPPLGTYDSAYNAIDSTISMISFVPLGGQGSYDLHGSLNERKASQCCVMVCFLHAALGFVLPGVIMYCWECHARLSFLMRERLVSREWARRTFCVLLVLAIWFSVIILLSLWACMRLGAVVLSAAVSCMSALQPL